MSASPKSAPASPPLQAPLPRASSYRTHTCGELRPGHVGQKVTLCGAVDRSLDERGFELRDEHGKVLVRLTDAGAERLAVYGVTRPTPESVLQVRGTVDERKPPGASPTGHVQVTADEADVLSPAKAPLLFDFRDDALPRADRIRHRYLYLRKPAVHEAFAERTRILAAVRRFLAVRRFVEVETPVLANRWTPEATDAFLAVREPGQVFALPGRRAVHAALLVASGFDRTFEVARRFVRKKTYGPFEQPEFSVLELTMSFAGLKDLTRLEDDLLAEIGRAVRELKVAVHEMAYEDALARYGTDAPDLRVELEIRDLTPFAPAEVRSALGASGAVRAIRLEAKALSAAGDASKRDALLAEQVKRFEGKKATVQLLAIGAESKATVAASTGLVAESLVPLVPKTLDARAGDVVLLVVAKERAVAAAISGEVRQAVGRALGLVSGARLAFARVTELPYQRFDPEAGAFVAHADPLAHPLGSDLDGDPRRARALAHDLVLNGVTVGGGAVRNHDLEVQRRAFEVQGLGAMDVDARHGRLLEALRYGLPPSGRIAIGIDRMIALLLGFESIDEVQALPKMADGTDPLCRAPWPIDPQVVRALFQV